MSDTQKHTPDFSKATPGPWTQTVATGDWAYDENYIEILGGCGYFDPSHPQKGFGLRGYITTENAALIASAPTLLRENQELREENERLREQCGELREVLRSVRLIVKESGMNWDAMNKIDTVLTKYSKD